MPDIQSNHDAPLRLPNGQLLPARARITVPSRAWAVMKTGPVVGPWVDGGYVSEVIATEAPAQEEGLYTAKHRGGGSYSVMEGDAEVIEGLSRSDAEEFNALSAAAKAAYVGEQTAKAD